MTLTIESVKKEILIHFWMREDCFRLPPTIIPDEEGLEKAISIAFDTAKNSFDRFKVPAISGFFLTNRITAVVDGHELRNVEPMELQPLSYFGAVGEKTGAEKKNSSYKNFPMAVQAITGERIMLTPGDRVYDLFDRDAPPYIVPGV